MATAVSCMTNTIDMHTTKNLFSLDFKPGNDDVIMGRGKKCFDHEGNKRLRAIVASKLDEYSATTTKKDKTKILLSIVSQVRVNSPGGGFIKFDQDSGLWFEVGDFLAREKVSQAFRDALHNEYRSSNEFKKKRKREQSNSSKDTSKRVRSQVEKDSFSKQMEVLPTQCEDLISPLGSGLAVESSPTLLDICMKLPNLSRPFPDSASSSSLITPWFDDESDPFEPVPIAEFSSKNVELFEPLPFSDCFGKFVDPFEVNSDCDNNVFKYNDVAAKGWSSQQQRSISKPTRNSYAARSA